jgi:hypothetical protein
MAFFVWTASKAEEGDEEMGTLNHVFGQREMSEDTEREREREREKEVQGH